jgi:23S rRNA pseudouridine955/2504/2580 synthase
MACVEADEAGLRLDRWFRRHYPELGHGRLQRLLRTGQIRIDGRRAKSGDRLAAGQRVRVPPFESGPPAERAVDRVPALPGKLREQVRSWVIHRDADVLVLDKPAGLAVQGGTGAGRPLDALLDALRYEAAERPRLVHRLDRDTSGVLVLGRTARAAAELARAFRTRAVRKLYWAVVVGVPRPPAGRIDLALAKSRSGAGPGERVAPDAEEGKRAVTLYRVVDRAGRKAAWLALEPLTGRTHQLRAHAAALGTPILGDGKYGGRRAFLPGAAMARRVHLHARAIRLPRPGGGFLDLVAPLPAHMAETFGFLGFDADDEGGGRFPAADEGP